MSRARHFLNFRFQTFLKWKHGMEFGSLSLYNEEKQKSK